MKQKNSVLPLNDDLCEVDQQTVRHISPQMRRKIYEIMSGHHEKVRQSDIETFLDKYGTSTSQVDRFSTSKNDSSTFF